MGEIPFIHPFAMLVCGPSQSGKSEFVLRLLAKTSTMIPVSYTHLTLPTILRV